MFKNFKVLILDLILLSSSLPAGSQLAFQARLHTVVPHFANVYPQFVVISLLHFFPVAISAGHIQTFDHHSFSLSSCIVQSLGYQICDANVGKFSFSKLVLNNTVIDSTELDD